MQPTICSPRGSRANTITKREIRALAKRLAVSQLDELRAVARTLDKLLAGEIVSHVPPCSCGGVPCWRGDGAFAHEHPEDPGTLCWLQCPTCEHVPIDCEICLPLVDAAWTMGVTFPDGDPEIDLVLPRTDREDWATEIIRRARRGWPPDAHEWSLEDHQKLRHEIRFSTDPRKARAAQRRLLRKEMTSCLLIHR